MNNLVSFTTSLNNNIPSQFGTKAPIKREIQEPSRTPYPIKIDTPAPAPTKPATTPSIPLPSKEPVPVGEQ